MSPLRHEVIDPVGADERLDARRDCNMGILRIAAFEKIAVPRQRHKRSEMRAGGISPKRDPVRINFQVAGTTAAELHRSTDVVHDIRISLLARFCETVAHREARITAFGEKEAPILE